MDNCLVFAKEQFADFFALMQTFGKIWAPVRVSDQSFAFKEVAAVDDIAFEALRTILPPKKLFFLPQEPLIRYDGQTVTTVETNQTPQVLFGVHPCDLAGLGVMDSIYSAPPADSHYWQRRQATLVIGLSCMPDKYCFCQSMGTDAPNKGYDIFLTDTGDSYFVQIQTPAGLQFVSSQPGLFLKVTENDKSEFKLFWEKRAESFSTGFKGESVPAIMELERDNKIWDELGNRCLSCGSCTAVCPTCYCFDIVDIAELNGKSGERKREWDSCQTVSFAKVAGDYNFRPGPIDRLKFWYQHKLHGFDDPYGFPTCVGCGRCTVSCPSGIDDIVGVVLQLQNKKDERDNEHR